MLIPLTARGHQLHPGSYIQSWSNFFMSQKGAQGSLRKENQLGILERL